MKHKKKVRKAFETLRNEINKLDAPPKCSMQTLDRIISYQAQLQRKLQDIAVAIGCIR
jgi:prefoldin subunit 5